MSIRMVIDGEFPAENSRRRKIRGRSEKRLRIHRSLRKQIDRVLLEL